MDKNLFRKIQNIYTDEIFNVYDKLPHIKNVSDTGVDEKAYYYVSILSNYVNINSRNRLIDLGAGFSTLPIILRHLGFDVCVADQYQTLTGGMTEIYTPEVVNLLTNYFRNIGVNIYDFDIQKGNFPFDDESFDIVTSFQAVEHFFHTPRFMFAEVFRILKPGGIVIVATPNAVNLRKRLSVVFGRTNYYDFGYYWNAPIYMGHIREPTLDELKEYFLRSGFVIESYSGRNFMGMIALLKSAKRTSRMLGKIIQRTHAVKLLEKFPTLCSDIHVVGRKPV